MSKLEYWVNQLVSMSMIRTKKKVRERIMTDNNGRPRRAKFKQAPFTHSTKHKVPKIQHISCILRKILLCFPSLSLTEKRKVLSLAYIFLMFSESPKLARRRLSVFRKLKNCVVLKYPLDALKLLSIGIKARILISSVIFLRLTTKEKLSGLMNVTSFFNPASVSGTYMFELQKIGFLFLYRYRYIKSSS